MAFSESNQGTAGPTEKVVAKLEAIPRLNISFYPTPIEEAPRFREALSWTAPSVPRIPITRDDYTGAGFGGNKVRKLEFVLAKAVAEGADTVVIVGGEGSNHARVTALLSARFGLRCYLMLNPVPVVERGLKPASLYRTAAPLPFLYILVCR